MLLVFMPIVKIDFQIRLAIKSTENRVQDITCLYQYKNAFY